MMMITMLLCLQIEEVVCTEATVMDTMLLCLQIEEGWIYGNYYDDERKSHPFLKPYHLLDEKV